MENREFDSIEHEVIYKKLVEYYENESNIKADGKYITNYSDLDMQTMKESKDLYAHRLITSHRKYIGKAIVFGKKVVRRLLKWYINPITEDQTIFNNATVNTIESLSSEVAKNSVEQVNKINELEKQVSKINELENQVSKINELENQVSKINELEKQISKINNLEETVAKIKNLEEREQLNDKIRKLDNMLSLNLQEETSFFEKISYSQSGEDTIVAYILYCLGVKNEEITYLDLGANHAKEISNTYYFYKNGGKGVLVDANPKLTQELSFYRHRDVVVNCIISEKENEEMDFYILSGDGLSTPDKEQALEVCKINNNIQIENIIKVKSNTVNNIIEKYFAGVTPTFISLDIEGHDLEVIKSVDFDRYRPKVIIVETIEYRPYLPINVKVDEVIDYLKTKDYVEYAFTGINSIFIDAKYMRNLGQEG